jgi:ADP-ribose pyrophosphatase
VPEEITTLTSRIAYQNRWLRVREDTIRRRDGSNGLYGVVERTDFVVVVPWQDGAVTLVEQYRYPIRARIWELPMGTWEHRPDTDPRALAAAELQEETGLIAADLRPVGTLLQGPGYCNQRGHVFLATGLRQGPPAREATEQDMQCRSFPLPALEAMISDGTIQDGMTLAALGLLRFRSLL